jgi:predicted DNA-binding protein YlxM (UPF0122 family)
MHKMALLSTVVQQIVELYQTGLSCPKIGKQFNVSGEYVRCLLKKEGIPLRAYHQLNRKHQVREDFFDQVASQEQAYLLGLLFADGNVHTKYNAITLKLQEQDHDFLLAMATLLMDKPILYLSQSNYVLKVSSHHMKQRLIDHGCIPNKSLSLRFPKLDPIWHSHFVRGYFDGDGSIYRYRNDFGCNLVSTQTFCQTTAQIITQATGIEGRIDHDKEMLQRGNKITTILSYGGNRRLLKVLGWLYRDATVYLPRKHQKYLELQKWTQQVDQRRLDL